MKLPFNQVPFQGTCSFSAGAGVSEWSFAQKQGTSPKQTAHPFGVSCFVYWDFVIVFSPATGNAEGEGYSYDWCTGEHPISPPKEIKREVQKSLSTWYVIFSPPWRVLFPDTISHPVSRHFWVDDAPFSKDQLNTPWKIKMEPQNWCFVDVFLFVKGLFQVPS